MSQPDRFPKSKITKNYDEDENDTLEPSCINQRCTDAEAIGAMSVNNKKRQQLLSIAQKEEANWKKFVEENTPKSFHEVHRLGGNIKNSDLNRAREEFLRKVAPAKAERKAIEIQKEREKKQKEEDEIQKKKMIQRQKAELNEALEMIRQFEIREQALLSRERFADDMEEKQKLLNQANAAESGEKPNRIKKETFAEKRAQDKERNDIEIEKKKAEQRKKAEFNRMLEQQYQHDISKQAARQKEHYTRNAEQSLKKFNTPEPESKATNDLAYAQLALSSQSQITGNFQSRDNTGKTIEKSQSKLSEEIRRAREKYFSINN